jgi:hypothetical protein
MQCTYERVEGRIRRGGEQSEETIMERGVKHGDSRSALLFIIVVDQIQCARRTA